MFDDLEVRRRFKPSRLVKLGVVPSRSGRHSRRAGSHCRQGSSHSPEVRRDWSDLSSNPAKIRALEPILRAIGAHQIIRRAGLMTSSNIECSPSQRGGKSQRMQNCPARDLVIPHEAREDWQAGRIGGRPSDGPEGVAFEIPYRSGAGRPLGPHTDGRIELVEATGVAVYEDEVPIGTSLDLWFRGYWIRARIRLGTVLKRDAVPGRPRIHDVDWIP